MTPLSEVLESVFDAMEKYGIKPLLDHNAEMLKDHVNLYLKACIKEQRNVFKTIKNAYK